MLHIYAWSLVLVEGNVTVNKLVQTIVQHPAFRETINSILTATNQEQSCLFPCITQVKEKFSSDLFQAIISYWAAGSDLEFCQTSCQTSTMETLLRK